MKSTCHYCKKPKVVYADNTQWLIHLAVHREAIIENIINNYSSCVLCSYPKEFVDNASASEHLRWTHTRSELIRWALRNLVTLS